MIKTGNYRNNNELAEFWRDPFETLNTVFAPLWGGSSGSNDGLEKKFSGFSTDVIEKDDEYIVQAELPGFEKEEISVDLKNDILTISASHNEEKKEEDGNTKYLRRERRHVSCQRSFRVENVDPADIHASYTNGILEVRFPKQKDPREEQHRIEIS